MMVEIRGIGRGNKGAELMLEAVVDRLGARHSLVAPTTVDYLRRARMGLYQKLWFDRLGRANLLLGAVPRRARKAFGLVTDGEVDAVLDASGFAYGDPWGPGKAATMAWLSGRWQQRGTKIILLPQALGPFRNPHVRRHFRRVLEAADRVYARDALSLEHVKEAGGPVERVQIAPDFTVLLEGRLPAGYAHDPAAACLVPNRRMLDRTTPEVAQHYFPFMVSAGRLLSSRGYSVFLLLFDSGDLELAKALQAELRPAPRIVVEESPVLLKGILGQCAVVVGSRYHALVSSLSQAVPSIGTSWSHKYQTLFEEYGCTHCLMERLGSEADLRATLDLVTDPASRARLVASLQQRRAENRRLALQMWSEVESVLGA